MGLPKTTSQTRQRRRNCSSVVGALLLDLVCRLSFDVHPIGITEYLFERDGWAWIATLHHFYLAPVLLLTAQRETSQLGWTLRMIAFAFAGLLVASRLWSDLETNANYAHFIPDEFGWTGLQRLNDATPLAYLPALAVVSVCLIFAPSLAPFSFSAGAALVFKGGVKRATTWLEVQLFRELGRFRRAAFPLHPGVFPFDRQRAVVVDFIESSNDRLEIDLTSTGAAEVPTAARIAKVEMTGQNSAAAIERCRGVLNVNVINAIRKLPNELDRIDHLPVQVAGVKVEAELLAIVDRVKGHPSCMDVEGDLGRVHFQGELDSALPVNVENRIPTIGKQLEPIVDHLLRNGRERVVEVPDARSRKPVDDVDAKSLGGASRVLHFLDGAIIDTSGIAVAPHVRGQDNLVALIDEIENRLAGQVVADRIALQIVPFKQLPMLLAIRIVDEGFLHVKVVAPTCQLDAVIPEFFSLPSHIDNGKICPLAGKKCDGSRHSYLLQARNAMVPDSTAGVPFKTLLLPSRVPVTSREA